ncbi:MAG TPA: hypothetical protein VNW06_06760, partial [Cytophagaceae bacterium]|nr:hypothetical protein [Cytophagaceae bacterium]
CWSTTSGPTIADNKTSDGTGTGTFISSITGLTPGTIYYVRAYATNSTGTTYGNEFVYNNKDFAIVNNFNLSFDGTFVNIDWTSTLEISLNSYNLIRIGPDGSTTSAMSIVPEGPSAYPAVQDFAGSVGSGKFTYNLVAVYIDGTTAIVATQSITI